MKSQYDLCLEVLSRLQKAALLEKILVIVCLNQYPGDGRPR